MDYEYLLHLVSFGLSTEYKTGLLARFDDRELLDHQTFFERYWNDENMTRPDFDELCDLIEEIYRIPAGLLRPDDDINKLTGKVSGKSWWQEPFLELGAGDNEFWLQEEFGKKLKEHGTYDKVERIDTIDELFRYWCGQVPKGK